MAERTIRVRNTKTGETRNITLEQAKEYGIEPTFFQKLVTSKGLPLGVGVGVGTLASLTGIGAPLAIPGAGAASGATYALQRLLSPLAGISEETPSEQLAGGGKEFVKGAASEAGGRLVGKAGSAVLGPLVSKLPFGSPAKVAAAVDVMKKEVGSKIDELLTPLENAPLTKAAIGKVLTGLNKLGASQTFKHNPAAIEFINGVMKLFSEGIGAGPAHGLRSDFGGQVFTKTGLEKTAASAADKAVQASKQIIAPGLKEGINEVAPGYSGLLREYGDLTKFGQNMVKPLRLTPASIASLLGFGAGSAVGGVPAGMAASSVLGPTALFATNPYLKFLLQKGVGTLIKYLQYPARGALGAGAGSLLDGYSQPGQEGEY